MVDLSLLAGAASSLKAASDITKAMMGLRDTALIQEKVIELQRVILAAQSDALAAQTDQFALLERIRDLEKEVAQMKAWETEKERYELKAVYQGGAFAYVLKADAQGAEPPHWICATCYQDHKKSILQRASQPMHGIWPYKCQTCKEAVFANWQGPSETSP